MGFRVTPDMVCAKKFGVLESLYVEPEFKQWMPFVDDKHPFESVCEHFGIDFSNIEHWRAKVIQKELQNQEGDTMGVFFKMYGYRRFRRAISRTVKATRSKSEFTNLKYFHQLGIPACVPVARGEYRNGMGIIRNCLLITKELPEAVQLNEFVDALEESDEPPEMKEELRRQVIQEIAANLREIHDHKFFHDDLKWRNVLVRREGDSVKTFWIDCPNGYFDKCFGLRTKHGTIKDLATLDHLAWRSCTDEERFYFLSCYSGLETDDPALKDLGKQVVDYRKRKLDD